MPVNFSYRVVRLDELTFESSRELAAMYKLSQCVWQENGRFELLLRVVNYSENPAEKVARIHRGSSVDGLCFVLDDEPGIAPPGPDLPGSYDSGGCEDPTIARVDGTYYVTTRAGTGGYLKRRRTFTGGRSRRSPLAEERDRARTSEQVTNPRGGLRIVQASEAKLARCFLSTRMKASRRSGSPARRASPALGRLCRRSSSVVRRAGTRGT